MNSVLNLILTHQPADAVARMVEYWSRCVPRESILIAYGGEKFQFAEIRHDQRLFVDDPRLRTRDHQRELQSYTQLLQAAAEFLSHRDEFRFIYFAEFDHIPLVSDLNQRQIKRLTDEGADLLAFHVCRVDDTSNPHFLYHASDDRFMTYWTSITRRSDPNVMLSMFGTGSFWTREAFCAVCAIEEPFPIYMEIYLPTLAHHLGFRVRDFAEQNRFVRALESDICGVDQARKEGAWTLHPLKRMWEK
jgi:hypothetical protein